MEKEATSSESLESPMKITASNAFNMRPIRVIIFYRYYDQTIRVNTTIVFFTDNSTFNRKSSLIYHEIVCPDKAYSCRDNETCCKLFDNLGYGCCPRPNAVCCSDGNNFLSL